MSISFGGLSSGLDTNAIIDQLLAIERQPITRLEAQKEAKTSSLEGVKEFDSKLDDLLAKVRVLDSSRTLVSRAVTTSSEEYLAATASSSAAVGSYDVKVGRLAQTEKVVYQGVADRDTTTFGTGSLVIDNDALGAPVSITIDSNNTLEGIRDAINAQSGEHGVKASIVNDGSGSPYRLVLTGEAVGNANISLDSSGLTGGATLPGIDAAISRPAQTALVQIDGISITSDTNTLTEAIPGLTLDLTQADPSFDPVTPNWAAVAGTTLTVANDSEGIKTKIEEFVTAFNEVVKAAGDPSLEGDSGVRSVLNALRSKFIDSAAGTGLFQLGIKSQKDGTLLLDGAKLSSIIKDDLAGVESLLAGDGTSDGIADELNSALTSLTSAVTGFLVGRQNNYDSTISRIDRDIARNELRVEALEKRLIAKFSVLEGLINSLNVQGNYLTQQMSLLSGGD